MADDPGGQHAAAAAAIDEEIAGVDVAPGDDLVHSSHQVVVVLAGIGILDSVAKGAAVAGGAAGIGVEQYVTLGGVVLPAEIEPHAVHPVGPPVDAEHEWILSLGIEAWRLDDPALDVQTVCRAIPDLFDFAKFYVLQHAVVNKGKLLRLRLAEVEGNHIGGLVIAGERAYGLAGRADAGHVKQLVALRDLPYLAPQ